MMNRIMTPRVAALAFAALPLTPAPALADRPARSAPAASAGLEVSLGETASLYVLAGHEHDRWRGRHGRAYRSNPWGQSRWQVRRLKRDALQRCSAAIERRGYRFGFRDVDIDDDFRIRQLGPRGFRIRFDEVEFEGRRREFERDVTCTVRHGHVVSVDGLPQPGRRGYSHRAGSGHGYAWDHGSHDRADRRDGRDIRRTGPGGQRGYGDLDGGRRGR